MRQIQCRILMSGGIVTTLSVRSQRCFYSRIASHLSALSRAASEGGPIEPGRLLLRRSLLPNRLPLDDESVMAEDAEDPLARKG